MHWMFLISTDCESRTPARVLQVLDNQRVRTISLLISTAGTGTTIHAVVDVESGKAAQIRDLLGRIPSIETVDCLAGEDSHWCRLTLLRIGYDSLSRPAILEAAAKLKLAIVQAGAYWAVVAADNFWSQIGDIEECFRSLGASVSIVQTAVGFRDEPTEEIRPTQSGCRTLAHPLGLAEPTG